jgi:outer membrane immunogenic protein
VYVGAHAGYAKSDADWTYTNINPYSAPGPAGPITAPRTGFSSDDFIVGGQVGANYQLGALVIGGEVSYTGMDLDDTRLNPGQFLPPSTESVRNSIGNLLLVTGRLGWTWDPHWLGYIKGGYARAEVDTAGFTQPPASGFDFNTQEHHNGWALGGGIEVKLHENVSVAVEYMHVALDEAAHIGDVPSQPPQFDVAHSVDGYLDAVTARLNLSFDPTPPAPLK